MQSYFCLTCSLSAFVVCHLQHFKFVESEHALHVGNAPSPAATSALPIADEIINRLF